MDQCCLDQWVKGILPIHIFLQIGHGICHIFWIWRNIPRISQCASLTADPILRITEFTGILFLTAHPLHQNSVCFFNQSVTQRERLKAIDRVFLRTDVIHNIWYIEVCVFLRKGVQNVIQRTLRPFDLGRKQCFLPHIHGNKQIHIRNTGRQAIQCSQPSICVNQLGNQLITHLNRRLRGKRIGAKRLISHFPWQISYKATGSVIHGSSFLKMKLHG